MLRWLFSMVLGCLVLASGLGGCSPRGAYDDLPPPSPALWEVTAPGGQTGWLFGTVHRLPRGMAWQSDGVEQAFAAADTLVVEVADLDDGAKLADTFTQLATTPGQPPLTQRIDPALAPKLREVLAMAQMEERQFAQTETWAAAIMLGQALDRADSAQGVDRALLAQAPPRDITELEGARFQLGLFDTLPPREQADLLAMVVAQAQARQADPDAMYLAWRAGDMAALEHQAEKGIMAHPQLRDVLLFDRNRAWAGRFARLLKGEKRPFLAVGAGHMIGPGGIPALLEKAGYGVKRIQ